jgi:hypothetical protein
LTRTAKPLPASNTQDVTTLVPPNAVAHRTARYGTINLLWLFGSSQQTPAPQDPQAIRSAAPID